MAETSKQKTLLLKKNHTSQKVKTNSKNEIVQAAVNKYGKKKCYVSKDKLRNLEALLQTNKKQFVFQQMLKTDTHYINSFTYSNVICLSNNNQHIIDQQFAKLTKFVESQEEPGIRFELRRFIPPILCHLYIELIKSRELKPAVAFLTKYSHLVAPRAVLEQKYQQQNHILDENQTKKTVSKHHQRVLEDHETLYFHKLMQTLVQCLSFKALNKSRVIVKFRSSKYEIHTTQAAMDTLMSFLNKYGHVLLIQIICTWFRIRFSEHDMENWTEDDFFGARPDENDVNNQQNIVEAITNVTKSACKGSAENSLPPELLKEPVLSGDPNSEHETRYKKRHQNVRSALITLRDTRGALLKNQIEFPHYFKIADRGKGVTSAHLCMNECHLVAGFNNSSIGLWSISQQTCRGKQFYRKSEHAACAWDLNKCMPWTGNSMEHQIVDEDEIDCDMKAHAQVEGKRETVEKQKFYKGKYEDNSFNDFGGIMLHGHGMGVTDVKFSKHYPLLYSSSKDHSWRVWRADNYNCSRVYRGHRYPVWCLDESPVAQYVATGSHDISARLWCLERDYPLITYAGHTQDVECIAFHPNGTYLATGSADLTVRLWCVTSGRLVRIFQGCKQPVGAICFSPDGKFLAAGGEESKVRIFDLAAGAKLLDLKEHTGNVTSIAWSTCGRELASASNDGTLRLWDVKKIVPFSYGENNEFLPNNFSAHRLMTTNSSNCQKLLRVLYSRSETICCFGA